MSPRLPARTIRRRLVAACITALAAPPSLLHAQSAPITNGDVPGAAAFTPGGATLVHEDFASAQDGFPPSSIVFVGGSMSFVEERGRRFLRVNDGGSFDLVLPALLPDAYTIEFDMLVPRGTGYAVEVRPATPGEPAGYAGLSRRARNPVVTCGPIGSGVYGASLDATRRFDDALARALVPCQIAVSAQGVRVFFAGQDAAAVPGVTLGRASRIRFHVPADAGHEALIGPIRVTTSGGAAQTVAAGGASPGSASPGGASPGGASPGGASSSAPPSTGAVDQPGSVRTPGTTVTATGGTPSLAGGTGVGPAGRGQQTVGSMGNTTVTRTPGSAAASLREQKKTPRQAVEELLQQFTLSLADLVAALAGGGYPPDEIAAWLREDNGANVETAIEIMRKSQSLRPEQVIHAVWIAFGAGKGPQGESVARQVVDAARNQLQASATDVLGAVAKVAVKPGRAWVALLRHARYTAADAAEALRIALGLDEAGVEAALRGQVSLEDLATALGSSFNTSAERFAELIRVGRPGETVPSPSDVAQVLSNVYRLSEPAVIAAMNAAGYPGDALVQAMKEAYGMTPAQIIARLRGGYSTDSLVQMLAKEFPPEYAGPITLALKGHGVPVKDIASAVRKGFGANETMIAKLLAGSGFDATAVAGALQSTFAGITPENVARALAAAGVPPGPIATALIDTFAMAAANVASLLASIGIK